MKKNILLLLPLLLAACVAPPVVLEVQHNAPHNSSMYVCRLKAFTTEFRSENSSRGKAKLDVHKQCLAKHNAMFCEEKDIVCQSYE